MRMTNHELDEATRLCAADAEPWGDDSECQGCGLTLHMEAPELEPRGLCLGCTDELVSLVPQLIAEVKLLRSELASRLEQIGTTNHDAMEIGERRAAEKIAAWLDEQATELAESSASETFPGMIASDEADTIESLAADIRADRWKEALDG